MPSSFGRIAPAVLVCLVSCGPSPAGDCPSATTPPGGPWARTYGGPLGDKAGAIASTPGGDLIVGGNTYSFGADVYDDWVLKLARSGEVLWQVRIEGAGTESADSVAGTRDGGAVFVSTRSIPNGPQSRRGALLVARLDCGGGLVWAKTFAVADVAFPRALRATPDGGFILTGAAFSLAELGDDCMVLKLSADGELEWLRAYGRPDGNESCRGIALSGSGYVLAGEYERVESGLQRSDVWLVGLGSRGEVEWERTYGEPGVSEARPAIHEDGRGTFLVASMRGGEPQLLAVDGSGAAIWQKSYRASAGVGVTGLWVSPDGSGTLIGTTSRPEDVWAMRVGPLGDPDWSRGYGPDTFDRGAAVTGFDDGASVLAGTLAWGSPQDLDEVVVLLPGSDGRAGSQGSDVPVTTTRMNVATRQETAVRVSVPSVDVASASLRVTRTQASVRAVP